MRKRTPEWKACHTSRLYVPGLCTCRGGARAIAVPGSHQWSCRAQTWTCVTYVCFSNEGPWRQSLSLTYCCCLMWGECQPVPAGHARRCHRRGGLQVWRLGLGLGLGHWHRWTQVPDVWSLWTPERRPVAGAAWDQRRKVMITVGK